MREYIGFISNENEICIDEKKPIVRCINCKYFYCLWVDACVCARNNEKFMVWVEPDGFCPNCGARVVE